MCPHCRRRAPLVYSGVTAVCSACGAPRTPLTGSSLTHAGKPAEVAGQLVSVVGWLALVSGLALAAFVALLAGLIGGLQTGAVTFVVLGAVAAFLFLMARYGSRGLSESARAARDEKRGQAVFELAGHRGGRLTARETGRALSIPEPEADALLTQLAKTRGGEVDLEVTDAGEVIYVFPRLLPYERPKRVRIAAEPVPGQAEAEAEREAEADGESRQAARRHRA